MSSGRRGLGYLPEYGYRGIPGWKPTLKTSFSLSLSLCVRASRSGLLEKVYRRGGSRIQYLTHLQPRYTNVAYMKTA